MASGQPKCRTTGHFFVCYPEHDIGFTCFHCLEEFAPSGKKAPMVSSYAMSRKRRSLHGKSQFPPPPLMQPPAEASGSGSEIGVRDTDGKRRSQPWRCLQVRCKLLACDSCSDKLVDPEYIANQMATDESSKKEKLGSGGEYGLGSLKRALDNDRGIKAGDSTPTDSRPERERLQNDQPRRPLPPIPTQGGRITAPAPPKPNRKPPKQAESAAAAVPSGIPEQEKIIETDGSDSEPESSFPEDDFHTKLFYRRAANVANSALSRYHHRLPARVPRQLTKSERPEPHPLPLHRPESSSSRLTLPPRPIPRLPVMPNDAPLEVDSEDEDVDEMPRLTIRSAADAANQAVRHYLQTH